jgi:hypothetical protein
MKQTIAAILVSAAASLSLSGAALGEGKTKVSEDAEVFILSPMHGAVLNGPVHVKIGHKGVDIRAAGKVAHNAGHHVLLIDAPMPGVDEDIPNDARHMHLADGSMEVTLDLKPGLHTLQLILVDHNHAVHDKPVMSEKPVTITVTD